VGNTKLDAPASGFREESREAAKPPRKRGKEQDVAFAERL
jgi:hypothetical protein